MFENVSKTYPNGHPALHDLNLAIADGELLVFVGPSGCGKSTLLRILAGLEPITSGNIRIGNHIVNTWTPHERNVAMVFQDYALYPTMTVRGNLEFPLRMRKMPAAPMKTRIDHVVAMLNLGDVLERLPKQLSGGQRQRVAMGRALVREPAIFLLDEPLSNLDAKLRTQVRAEISDLQKRIGTTMIYVTHDQVEAMTLGQRIAIMNRGRLQQVADPTTLYRKPANAFVAGFVGNPPMNLFTSRLEFDADGNGRVYWENEGVAVDRCNIPPCIERSGNNQDNVTWGIRPEHAALGSKEGVSAMVSGIEYLGHETLVYLVPAESAASSAPMVVRLAGNQSAIERGALVRLSIPSEAVTVFDYPLNDASLVA